MVVAASSVPSLEAVEEGGWRLQRWSGPRVVAGITDRHTDVARVLDAVHAVTTIEAEQVHGASIATVSHLTQPFLVGGCDGLLTTTTGLALAIRTADCLPIFFADSTRGAIGMAHAGWRGLAAQLPARMVAAFRHHMHSDPGDLDVAIGPAIRACCYEVGPEFHSMFEPFVQQRAQRLTCDLITAAVDQLRRSGIPARRIVDSRRCTACDLDRWFSVRREGAATGRLTSFIMLRS